MQPFLLQEMHIQVCDNSKKRKSREAELSRSRVFCWTETRTLFIVVNGNPQTVSLLLIRRKNFTALIRIVLFCWWITRQMLLQVVNALLVIDYSVQNVKFHGTQIWIVGSFRSRK